MLYINIEIVKNDGTFEKAHIFGYDISKIEQTSLKKIYYNS